MPDFVINAENNRSSDRALPASATENSSRCGPRCSVSRSRASGFPRTGRCSGPSSPLNTTTGSDQDLASVVGIRRLLKPGLPRPLHVPAAQHPVSAIQRRGHEAGRRSQGKHQPTPTARIRRRWPASPAASSWCVGPMRASTAGSAHSGSPQMARSSATRSGSTARRACIRGRWSASRIPPASWSPGCAREQPGIPPFVRAQVF